MPLHGFLFGLRQHFGVSPPGRPRSRDVILVIISPSFFTFSRNCGAAGSICCSFSQSITHIYAPLSQSVLAAKISTNPTINALSTHACVEFTHACVESVSACIKRMSHFSALNDFALLFQPLEQTISLRQTQMTQLRYIRTLDAAVLVDKA